MKLPLNTLLLILIATIHCEATPATVKMNTVNIRFEGREFAGLNLRIQTDDKEALIYTGQSIDNKKWTFSYPDSIYDKISSMSIAVPQTSDLFRETIVFQTVIAGDSTKKTNNYCFQRGISNVHARLLSRKSRADIPSTTVNQTFISNTFLVSSSDDPELTASLVAISILAANKYEDFIKLFSSSVRQFPNSHKLVAWLWDAHHAFESKNDVNDIFDLFSEALRESYYGRQVNAYLNRKLFVNSYLPDTKTGKPSPLIADSTKYNLIIFSTSWCVPCKKLIPDLKELYAGAGNKLEILYISMDEAKTVEHWRKQMAEYEIPWRSVVAADSLKEIERKYSVTYFPTLLLVAPNQEITQADRSGQVDFGEIKNFINL